MFSVWKKQNPWWLQVWRGSQRQNRCNVQNSCGKIVVHVPRTSRCHVQRERNSKKNHMSNREWRDESEEYFEILERRSECKIHWGNPCKAIATYNHSDFHSGTSVLDGFRSLCCMKEYWDGFDGVTFSTQNDIVAETAIVSFHTLPVRFQLPTISKNFEHAVLFPDSWPRRSSQTFHFWPQKF